MPEIIISDDKRRTVMTQEAEDTDFEERFEKKTDFHFIEHWKEGERPIDWFADWHRLNACIYCVEIVNVFQICEHKLGTLSDRDLSKSTPPGMKDGLKEKERERYIDLIAERPFLVLPDETENDAKLRHEVSINVFNKRFHSRAVLASGQPVIGCYRRWVDAIRVWGGWKGHNKHPPH